jgi:hypothetical protein
VTSDGRLEGLADLFGRPKVIHRAEAHGNRVRIHKRNRRVDIAFVHLNLDVVLRVGTTKRLLAVHAEAAIREYLAAITNASLELGVRNVVDSVASPLLGVAGNHVDDVVLEEMYRFDRKVGGSAG